MRCAATIHGPGRGPGAVAADAACELIVSGARGGAVYVHGWRKGEGKEKEEAEEEDGQGCGMEVVGVLAMPPRNDCNKEHLSTQEHARVAPQRSAANADTSSSTSSTVTAVTVLERRTPHTSTLPSQNEFVHIIAGDANGTVVEFVYNRTDGKSTSIYNVINHSDGITSLSSSLLRTTAVADDQDHGQRGLLVTTSSDNTSRILLCNDISSLLKVSNQHRWTQIACFETLSKPDLCSAISEYNPFPSGANLSSESCTYFVAIAGADRDVKLYASQNKCSPPDEIGSCFELCCRLKGHADWIRSLAFRPQHMNRYQSHEVTGKEQDDLKSDEESYLLLASGSQDRQIRLWRISLQATANGGLRDILPSYKFSVEASVGH